MNPGVVCELCFTSVVQLQWLGVVVDPFNPGSWMEEAGGSPAEKPSHKKTKPKNQLYILKKFCKVCQCLWHPEEGVTGSCELLHIGAGNQTEVLWDSSQLLFIPEPSLPPLNLCSKTGSHAVRADFKAKTLDF